MFVEPGLRCSCVRGWALMFQEQGLVATRFESGWLGLRKSLPVEDRTSDAQRYDVARDVLNPCK